MFCADLLLLRATNLYLFVLNNDVPNDFLGYGLIFELTIAPTCYCFYFLTTDIMPNLQITLRYIENCLTVGGFKILLASVDCSPPKRKFKISVWILKNYKYDVQSKMSNLNFENGFDVSKLLDLRIKIITLRNDDALRNMIDSAVIIICQRFLFVLRLLIWWFRID